MTTLFGLNCLIGVLLVAYINSAEREGFTSCVEAVEKHGAIRGSAYILIAWILITVFWLPLIAFMALKEAVSK